MRCGFPAERDFRAIHAVDARFAAGRAASWNDDVAGKKAELHQAARDVFRQIQAIEHASFSLGELRERTRKCAIWHSAWFAVDTHLQHQSVSASRHSTSRTPV